MNPGRTGLAAGIAMVLLVAATVLATSQASAQPPRPTPTATPTATEEATPTTTPTATAEPTPTARIEVVAREELPGDALIRGGELFTLLLAVSLGGMVLLALMVCSRFVGVRSTPAGNDQTADTTFKRQIEGMILVMVVVAVILLGVTEKIGQEGLVSVLAAIAGYAVGRTGSS